VLQCEKQLYFRTSIAIALEECHAAHHPHARLYALCTGRSWLDGLFRQIIDLVVKAHMLIIREHPSHAWHNLLSVLVAGVFLGSGLQLASHHD
jgi:hypothetical protein